MKELLKKFGGFSIGPIVCAVLGFVLIPLITYFISPDEYGRASMFSLAVSVAQMVLYLGLDQAYVKKYYETEDKTKLLANVMFPPIILVVILECAIFLLRRNISFWLFGSYDELGCVRALMLMPPTLVVEQFAITEVRMKQRGVEYSVLTILIKLFVLVVTVGLLAVYERSFRAVVWGTAAAQALYAVLLLVFGKARIILSPEYIDRGMLRELLRFSLPLIPAAIIGWILSGMDRVMLRAMSGYAVLGVYDVAAKVSNILAVAQSCFASFWVPLAHQWNNDGGDTGRFETVGRAVCLVMSFIMLAVLFFKDVIFMIFNTSYSEAVYIMPFLLVYPIMYTASEVPVMGIYFKSKTKSTLVVSGISAVVNLALNALLIPRFGAEGAAMATGLSYIVFFWCRTLLSRKVWYKFALDGYIFTTVLVLAAAILNTVIKTPVIYFINILLFAVLGVFFREDIKRGASEVKKLMLRKEKM